MSLRQIIHAGYGAEFDMPGMVVEGASACVTWAAGSR
jgi:hypothetical protein